MGKYILVGVCVFMMFSTNLISYSATLKEEFRTQSISWYELSNQVLTATKHNELDKAREYLETLSHQFSKSNLVDKKLSIYAIRELSELIINVEEALNPITPNKDEIIRKTTRLVLAFDAVSHPNRPLWKDYYPSLEKKLANSIHSKDRDKSIQSFLDEYDMIRPALVVTKNASLVNQLDSLLRYIQGEKKPNVVPQIEEARQLLHTVFFGSERDVMAIFHPLYQSRGFIPILWISFFIITVLGVISIKTYRRTETSLSC